MTGKSGVDVVRKAQETVLESVFKDTELGPLYGYLHNKAYYGLYCLLARVANRTGQKSTGAKFLLKAIKTSPGMLCEKRGLSLLFKTSKTFVPRPLSKFISRSLMILKLR
jgi:hypothetical protein